MADFSVIIQNPTVRRIVQDGALEKEFEMALYPKNLWRAEAEPIPWQARTGDTKIFTGNGLIDPDCEPITPGNDLGVTTYSLEQWAATMQLFGKAIDTDMPTDYAAIASMFLNDGAQVGRMAGQTMSRVVRNRLFAAALSGWTVAAATAAAAATTISLKSLNGFTRARRPDLAAGEPVRFEPVSTNNPLKVSITLDDASIHNTTITAYSPTLTGNLAEIGPGTVTIADAIPGGRSVLLRAAIFSSDRTFIVRVGGGNKVDDVGSSDLMTMAALRSAVAHMQDNNVPKHPDGMFHCHLDSTSQAQIFSDTEARQMLQTLAGTPYYTEFTLGKLFNSMLIDNSESPRVDTVLPKDGTTLSAKDPFPGELYNNGNASTGVKVHRPIVTGGSAIKEYWANLDLLTTEAGITGKTGNFTISANGIEVPVDRVMMIIRAPLDRAQQKVSTAWKFMGDWTCRTDAGSGDASRYKRECAIEHGE